MLWPRSLGRCRNAFLMAWVLPSCLCSVMICGAAVGVAGWSSRGHPCGVVTEEDRLGHAVQRTQILDTTCYKESCLWTAFAVYRLQYKHITAALHIMRAYYKWLCLASVQSPCLCECADHTSTSSDIPRCELLCSKAVQGTSCLLRMQLSNTSSL